MSGANTRGKGRKGDKGEKGVSVPCLVDKDMIDTLFSSLNQLRVNLGMDSDPAREPKDGEEDGEPQDIRGVITELISAVQTITNKLSEITSVQEEQEKKLRYQEDEMDEIRQRSLKGNIIVSSLPNKNKGKVSLLKSDDKLKSEKLTMQAHVCTLVKDKYEVLLPEEDIQACHRLPNGSVVLRIWNRKEGSAWESLVSKIKSSENSEFNVYFNFHLTAKRSTLLYECRMLKEEVKIHRFFSDENGSTKLKVKPDSKDKVKLTYMSKSFKDMPVTFNKAELLKIVSKHI